MSNDGRLPDGERLQKVLASVGYGSRRICEGLIEQGRVRVNGVVAILGCRVDPDQAKVEVDGVAVGVRPDLVYYLLHKPRGLITTSSDPQGRPTVVELVPPEPRVFAVGRLDVDTEGLLILTNDGDLAHRLAHPSYGVNKEYLVELESAPTPGQLRQLRRGVLLNDGPTAPARAALVEPRGLRLVVHEGRNRQVRRMCEAIGHRVIRLIRVRIGPISDGRLAAGQWRTLSSDEVRGLQMAVAEARNQAGNSN